MKTKTSDSVEDYLKTIYDLTQNYGLATTSKIAEVLEVTPASVSGMIKKLASLQPALVVYRKHRGVVLTPSGNKIALEIIRHHRLLELFLKESLGFSWDEVDEEADRLEHVISEEMEERIAQTLGDPVFDPHGDPIPTKDLLMPDHFFVCLNELRPGQGAIIRRVRDTDPDLLRYLSGKGVIPDARLIVIGYSHFDENIELKLNACEESVVLGPKITRQIFVEVLPDE
ncbi:MAG: metal-dependent transcriptional regulator [Anaerolineales bacterium]|nr:metal-dependent transcriptional regulator [Anaerolineales bacterium]